jgi:hypothetical protein
MPTGYCAAWTMATLSVCVCRFGVSLHSSMASLPRDPGAAPRPMAPSKHLDEEPYANDARRGGRSLGLPAKSKPVQACGWLEGPRSLQRYRRPEGSVPMHHPFRVAEPAASAGH